MKKHKATPFLYWLPRVCAVVFTACISIFALDAFSDPHWPLALFMHLIPTFVLIVLTGIAWKRERFGGALFFLAGFLLTALSVLRSPVVTVPVMVIGVLFIVSGSRRSAVR